MAAAVLWAAFGPLPVVAASVALKDRIVVLCPEQATAVNAVLDRLLDSGQWAPEGDQRTLPGLVAAAINEREAMRYDKAEQLFAHAVDLSLTAGAEPQAGFASTLVDLGQIRQWRSDYAGAKALHQCAGHIQRQRVGEDSPVLAMILAHEADFERQFATTEPDQERASGHLNESERLSREAIRRLEGAGADHASELAFAVSVLAHALTIKNPLDPEVLTLYRRAFALNAGDARCDDDCLALAVSQDNLGQHLTFLREYAQAEPHLLQALARKERLRGVAHDTTATSVNSLARLYQATGRSAEALTFHRRAVFIVYSKVRSEASADSAVLSRLAELTADLAHALEDEASPAAALDAVFFFKLSVNARQQMRAGAAALDPSYRDAMTRVVAGTYYQLARLLVAQGRLKEAEQVLLALKEAEFFRFVRGAVEFDTAPVSLNAQEMQLQSDLDGLARRLTEGRMTLVRAQAEGASSKAYEQAQVEMAALQAELSQTLSALSVRLVDLGRSVAWNALVKDSRLAQVASALSNSPTGEPVAIVMYVPEPRVTTVIVTAADGTMAFPLAEGDGTDVLYPLINQMRYGIQARSDYRAPANALYKKLVAPVLEHLRQRGLAPQNLMLYLTDRLRLLPFAALIDDGGKFLVQRYRLSTLSPASLPGVELHPGEKWSVQAFGKSNAAGGMGKLLAVEDELQGIVRTSRHPSGALPGETYLNEKFDRESWQSVLDGQPRAPHRRPVIHVATHFSSPPAGESWQKGFLLLGTGERFLVSDMATAGRGNLRDIELLALSACSTEFVDATDGSEFEGLGMIFQKRGVQAVIGTLWAVDDQGGSTLMKSFYSYRGALRAMSKAAALQKAQLAMIKREVRAKDRRIDVSHPYYWAPFVLVGNWQ